MKLELANFALLDRDRGNLGEPSRLKCRDGSGAPHLSLYT